MPFIVFSGLPGSGKSTLARQIAPELGLPILDKDEFLEFLFETRGLGDSVWRATLSREADERLAASAQACAAACLVSWWRHPSMTATASGTPTDWLARLPGPLIEIHCDCSVETAASRFAARSRHPGHLDSQRPASSLHEQLRSVIAAPLACGPVIIVPTEEPVSVTPIVRRVRAALNADAVTSPSVISRSPAEP